MPDFASSLYLGLRHGSRELEPWDALTTGRPAALDEEPAAVSTAGELASLVGCEAGTLLPSTLHLFEDLFGVLSRRPIEIFMDASTYPTARRAVEHVACRGVPLHTFARNDAGDLAQRLTRRRRHAEPVVVCDGLLPGRDRQPPLRDYADLVQRHGGSLVIDDTQSLGIHGNAASPSAPYGQGGGGSLQRHGIAGPHLIVGASLAKGFGVPVAVLAGTAALLQRFDRHSETRVHSSAASMADIGATRHALAVNRRRGDRLRLQLWHAVLRLRNGLAAMEIDTRGGDFPVQTLVMPPSGCARLHQALSRAGVRTVLHADRVARLSFVLRADHGGAEIDRALAVTRCWWSGDLPPVPLPRLFDDRH